MYQQCDKASSTVFSRLRWKNAIGNNAYETCQHATNSVSGVVSKNSTRFSSRAKTDAAWPPTSYIIMAANRRNLRACFRCSDFPNDIESHVNMVNISLFEISFNSSTLLALWSLYLCSIKCFQGHSLLKAQLLEAYPIHFQAVPKRGLPHDGQKGCITTAREETHSATSTSATFPSPILHRAEPNRELLLCPQGPSMMGGLSRAKGRWTDWSRPTLIRRTMISTFIRWQLHTKNSRDLITRQSFESFVLFVFDG